MSERYNGLFSLGENLYAQGSPVLICAGKLLKDNQTGDKLAQLKYKNICDKKIVALTVRITLSDAAGRPVDVPVKHTYSDLSIGRDAEFGQKTPVYLSSMETCGFDAYVTEVIFSDRSVWTASDEAGWKSLAAAKKLSEAFDDGELVKQYCIRFGDNCTYSPVADRDLWICTCGAMNHEDESACHLCGSKQTELFGLDMDSLKKDRDERIEKEKRQEEAERLEHERKAEQERIKAEKEAEQKRIADEKKKKKVKTIAAIFIPAVAVCVAFVVLLVNVIIPNSKYNSALELADAGKYEEAIAAFETLDGYKDSEEQIKLCQEGIMDNKYDAAVKLYDNSRYQAAIDEFEKMDGYKDSAEKIKACHYKMAEELFSSGQKNAAAMEFGKAGDYNDAVDRANELWAAITQRKTIATEDFYAIGLTTKGTVIAVGEDSTNTGRKNVTGWSDIIAVDVGGTFSCGLRADGTVVYTRGAAAGLFDILGVPEWKNIVAIASGGDLIGLKSDGTVVTTGIEDEDYNKCDLSGWSNIISVAAGDYHVVGLRSDGTVVAAGHNDNGECNVSTWYDIVQIDATTFGTIGLRSDGTVVITGADFYNQRNGIVRSWKNVEHVTIGLDCAYGLKKDGSVYVAGPCFHGEDEARTWNVIVSIEAGDAVIGLKADGSVVATGLYTWKYEEELKSIKLPNRKAK